MIVDLIKSPEFQDMMERDIREMILFLLERDIPFGLLCNIEYVAFDPPLPPELSSQLQSVTLFAIAGYTFESFEIEEHHLSFEAGFGPQNFGSLVSMPILTVMQIVVEDTPLLVNMAIPSRQRSAESEEPGVKSSLEALLSNPENRRFLKEGSTKKNPDGSDGD
ncbi:hypothetical protein [Hydrogenimonas sp.]